MKRVLLDNNVVSGSYMQHFLKFKDYYKFYISVRTSVNNAEYLKKYSFLDTIPDFARFDHSTYDSGEVFHSKESAALSQRILALAAHQKAIYTPDEQTNNNQRDDADIVVAAIYHCDMLVSNDHKFMKAVRDEAYKYGLVILSSEEFTQQAGELYGAT